MSVTHPGPETQAAAAQESFQPIGDYGLLADCNSAALVDRGGSIDWLCMPRYDSPAVFARILDPGAGHWSLTPSSPLPASEATYREPWSSRRSLRRTPAGSASLTLLPSPPVSAGTSSDSTFPTNCCVS